MVVVLHPPSWQFLFLMSIGLVSQQTILHILYLHPSHHKISQSITLKSKSIISMLNIMWPQQSTEIEIDRGESLHKRK